MIRNRTLLKTFAVFFVVEILISTILPSISWALTAGPTAPEFSSFEPVDTTDMVNLATGELVYNTPLLEVPGPAGGYPLSLSYHAGIKPEQEASWVGLGFTLNPGAISRTINGFADDNIESKRQVRDYWDGGTTTTRTFNLGFSLPVKGMSGNLTIARTQDTYKGFSIKAYASMSINPAATFLDGLQPSMTGNYETPKMNNPTGRMQNEIFDQGIGSLSSGTSMDVSIGSGGIRGGVSVAGHQIAGQGGVGTISSFTNVTNVGSAPTPLGFLSIKDLYTRYWSDQTDALFTYGSLYSSKNDKNDHYGEVQSAVDEFKSYSNDIYNIYEVQTPDKIDLKDEADPAKQIGGSLPSYDQYMVAGQGIGGIIEPYIFENGDMRGQNLYYRDPTYGHPFTLGHTLKHHSLKGFTTSKQVDFRFKNDFSNSLTVSPAGITDVGGILGTGAHTVTANASGFDNSSTRQKLEGSRHIDWYTNQQITDGTAKAQGFVDCYNQPSDRAMSMQIYDNYLQPEAFVPVDKRNYRGKQSGIYKKDLYSEVDHYAEFIAGQSETQIRFQSLKPRTVSLSEKIGGFKITNESGVTYHYGLPVYSYNEYTRMKMKKPLKGAATVTEIKNDEPYAYTWLLTAITGPDYVDRGGTEGLGNGILDDSDFGYWVKFDYGKWTDSYQWRTPHTGYVTDVESEYETFSYGIKELYYLDAIETKSHKAIFIKSKRKDGRGVTSRLEGGSNPRKYIMRYKFGATNEIGHVDYSVSPVSTLKLDAIYLCDKAKLNGHPIGKSIGLKYNDAPISDPYIYGYKRSGSHASDYEYSIYVSPTVSRTITIRQGEDFFPVKYHNGNLVFDDGDLAKLKTMPVGTKTQFDIFRESALKIIEFDTDYSLAPGVANSIGHVSDFGTSATCKVYPGASICPPAEADLDFEWPFYFGNGCFLGDRLGTGIGLPFCCRDDDKNRFYSDDPLADYFNFTGGCSNAVKDIRGEHIVYQKTGKLTLKKLRFLGHGGENLIPATQFSYAYNPTYNAKKIDDWGYYKSDYSDAPISDYLEAQEGTTLYQEGRGVLATRKITTSSAENTDAWSLSSVKLPLGTTVNIKYEANTYSKSVYNDFHVFGIQRINRVGFDKVEIFFKEKGLPLNNFFSVNSTVSVKALYISKEESVFGSSPADHDIYNSPGDNVVEVGTHSITITAPQLNEFTRFSREKMFGTVNVSVTPYFISGVVIVPEPTVNKYAGGVRVKEIAIDEFGGHTSSTQYSYTKPGTDISSGITSYKPYNSIGVHLPTHIDFFSSLLSDEGNHDGPNVDEEGRKDLIRYKAEFQKLLNQLDEKILLFGREAPAPGAMYEFVTVKNKFDDRYHDNFVVSQFKVFDENMITLQVNDYPYSQRPKKQVTVRNEASDIGSPVTESVYSTNSNILLRQKRYGYLYDEEDRGFETAIRNLKQGVVEQSFHKHITVQDYTWNGYNHNNGQGPFISVASSLDKAVVTKKEERSNVMTSIEELDMKTGRKTITENHSFDFFSGAPLKTLTTDQHGNQYLTEVVPAYSLKEEGTEVYPGMGLMLFNPANKNMITQGAATYVYKLADNSEPEALVSASVQTWSKNVDVLDYDGTVLSTDPRQAGIWRKHAEYSWKGDDAVLTPGGHYPIANFQAFTFSNVGTNSSQWQKLNTICLYDAQSHALMAKNINEKSAATKMSGDHLRVIATVANSEYHEFAYAGGEEAMNGGGFYPGGVKQENGTVVFRTGVADASTAHTGKAALQLSETTQKAFLYNFTAQANTGYHVSVWVNSDRGRLYYKVGNGDPQVSGAPVDAKKSGDWYLLTFNIPQVSSNASLQIWCGVATAGTCNFDDFRIHPREAAMISYVYNEWGELSHILDNNNLYTHYVYDGMGRLKETYKETFKNEVVKTGEVKYHYARSVE